MKTCGDCGKELVDAAGDFCVPCEIEILAREMPDHLKDMKAVYRGEQATSDGMRVIKAVMEKNPDRFLTRLEKAEHDWREQIARLKDGGRRVESEEEIEDKPTESLEATIKELLGVEDTDT